MKGVLSGTDDHRVSLAGAARAAGVTVQAIKRWVRRSAQALPDDDPLVHEIAPFIDGIVELQAGRLEDVAWERSVHGWKEPVFYKGERTGTKRKFDNTMLMKLLKARDPRYLDRVAVTPELSADDKEEIFNRLLAGERLAKARQEAEEAEKNTIDLEEDDEGVFSL